MVKYDTIFSIINEYVIKCARSSPRESSGLIRQKDDMPRFEGGSTLDKEEFDHIIKVMNERYGFETLYSNLDGNALVLYDRKNGTTLDFSGSIDNDKCIDFTNNDNANYNLDDVLFYYDAMPTVIKKSISGISFETENGNAPYCVPSMELDGRGGEIHITRQALREEKGDYFNLQQVLYHEAGHAFDAYLKYHDSVGDTTEYKNCKVEDSERFSSLYGYQHFTKTGSLEEDFAETVSVVAFDNLEDKSNVLVQMTHWGDEEDYDEFQQKHESSCTFVRGLLDGTLSGNNLTYIEV